MSENETETCLAAVFHQTGRPLEFETFELPTLGAGETLVRIKLCTLCGSDLHTLTGARIEPTPSILGHEIIGEICEVGNAPPLDIDGQALQKGDRVTWSVCVSCFDCDRCRSGISQKCLNVQKYGHSIAEGRGALSGGLAQNILLRPGTSIAKLPPELPDHVACPINCATSTIAAAFRTAGDVKDRRVVILGAGMLGLTAAAFANHAGAADVSVCDVDSDRLGLAERFGADRCINSASSHSISQLESKFDVVIECSGAAEAVESTIRLGDIGARIVLVGSVMNSRPVEFDPARIVRRWLSIAGVHNYAPEDLRRAIEFIGQSHQTYPFADLVEETFSLSEINQAIEYSIDKRPIRVAVRT